jgi:hypothetical protein
MGFLRFVVRPAADAPRGDAHRGTKVPGRGSFAFIASQNSVTNAWAWSTDGEFNDDTVENNYQQPH